MLPCCRLTKAIVDPSGDQTGRHSFVRLCVSFVSAVPSAFIMKMSSSPSRSLPKRIFEPSPTKRGETHLAA